MAVANLGGTVTISVFVILISAVVWRVLITAWFRPKKVEKMLKGQGLSAEPYRFLVGDLSIRSELRKRATSIPMNSFSHDIFSRVEPLMHHTINKHGNNSFVWMGPVPSIYITDPELIREIYTRPMDFELPKFNLAKYVIPGLIGYTGEKWRNARRVVNPCFHLDNIKLMVPALYDSCVYMIGSWEKKIPKSNSLEIDVHHELLSLSGDAISRAAFNDSHGEGTKIFQLLSEQFCLLDSNLELNYIPGWRFLPTKANNRMSEIDRQINDLIKGIVLKRIKEEESRKEVRRDDMLGLLLESNMQCNSLTTEQVAEQCKLFYQAGQETTSLLLTWTMILLSKHQNWQEKAREEVMQTFGNNIPDDYANLNSLKTVTMVLHEVLRLYPPVNLTVRWTNKDCELGTLSLPANTLLNISAIFMHQNPQIWGEDVNEFNPERFSQGVPKDARGNMAFFPFGYGPRICMGQSFALLQAQMAISMILQRFSFELSTSYSHAPSHILTLKPQFGAQIVLHRL